MAVRGRYWKNPTLVRAFDAVRAEYDAAKDLRWVRRRSGVASGGAGADYHYRNETDLFKMQEIGRAIDRNDPFIGQCVSRLVNNVLQGGVVVDPDTGDDALDVDLAARFEDWASDPDQCDVTGENTLHGLAEMVLRARIVDGDIFGLPLEMGALQLIEGHRCKTPTRTTQNVVLGILLDPMTRERKEYWFTKEDVGPMGTVRLVNETVQYKRNDANGNRAVLHVYDPKRCTQTRGVTAFAPMVGMITMHDDIQYATLIKQQFASFFAILRERPIESPLGDPAAIGSESTEIRDDGSALTVEDIAPGMEWTGAPGEKLQMGSPNIPSTEYFEHVRMILQFLASNLDLPLAIGLLDPSDTNFSSQRWATDQARIGWRRQQRIMIDRFYRPTYQWRLRWMIAEDPILRAAAARLGDRFFRHGWNPPRWPYIDPEKDAKSDVVIIRNGLSTRRATLGERGLKIEDVDRDAIADRKRFIVGCITAADEINGQFPDAGVTWRDVESMLPEEKATPAAPAENNQDTSPASPSKGDKKGASKQ